MLSTKFPFIWPSSFREDFLVINQSINQKQELHMESCLLTNRAEITNLYRGSSIDASYQVSVHLAKRFQGRRFF
jgi:hypothetical protein